MHYDIVSGLSSLALLTDAKTRSISPENPTGAPGMGGRCPVDEGSQGTFAKDLGLGWKTNPCIILKPGETIQIADIQGPAVIDHIWMTNKRSLRAVILRFYWDDQAFPSVECPLGDFFGLGWDEYVPLSSLAVCVNPANGLNCYWKMPFLRRCRITLENTGLEETKTFYQITYTLTGLPAHVGYFHAQFRRVNPLPHMQDYVILDGVQGHGHYAGTYVAWGSNGGGWWGEGELKFFLDDDKDFPTICGTGTEDYFCGAYAFIDKQSAPGQYQVFCTPYAGLHQLILPKTVHQTQPRFGMYRWHITDPIRFEKRIRITMQALGMRSGPRYRPLMDDIASVAYWYQSLPSQPLFPLPDADGLEIL